MAEARKTARQVHSDNEYADPAATTGSIERVQKRRILPEFGDRAADQITRSE